MRCYPAGLYLPLVVGLSTELAAEAPSSPGRRPSLLLELLLGVDLLVLVLVVLRFLAAVARLSRPG